MSAIAITAENLSKAYLIGAKEQMPDSLMGAIGGMLKAPWTNWSQLRRLNTYAHRGESEDIHWAVNDVSFEVKEGEVFGIIGRNGAGKSTLLKILSRITEPTSGQAMIHGRVASLLEVGTGFHPELSGRENVYLNGTIMGMTKREIDAKFDEIVDFSGVEKFLDTPIKRYSSGMKVRLAFAVSAHLDPEILIIDEVLAVGDADFRKKCMGRMQDVAESGRTVLFVSHNLPAIRSLTDRCAFMKTGRLVGVFDTDTAIDKYVEDCTQEACEQGNVSYFRRGGSSNVVQFTSVSVDNADDTVHSIPQFESGDAISFVLELDAREALSRAYLSLTLVNNQDTTVSTLFSSDNGAQLSLTPGKNRIRCDLPRLALAPGRYTINTGVTSSPNSVAFDVLLDLPVFEIVLPRQETASLDWPNRPWGAVLVPDAKWYRQ
ncbi:MAG: ABC transporter ATP-binding protein [Aureliella sp.]